MTFQRWTRRVLTAACAVATAAGVAIAGAGAASATVDQNVSYNQEPNYNPGIVGQRATQVLSLSITQAGGRLVQVNGNVNDNAQSGSNGLISLWDRANTDNDRKILQPNELWEFVPSLDNYDHTISAGYGWLRNRMSGKCLDVTGAPAAGTIGSVGQYPCMNDLDHANQLWTLNKNGHLQVKYTGYVLQPTGGSYSTGGGSCTNIRTANGTQLTVGPETAFTCSTITAAKENYRYATNPVTTEPSPYMFQDNAWYTCMKGWQMQTTDIDDSISEVKGTPSRANNFTGVYVWPLWDFINDTPKVQIQYGNAGLPGTPYHATGQIYLTCSAGS